MGKSKNLSQSKQESIKRILFFRKGLRDLADKLTREDLNKEEIDTVKSHIFKLRNIISNLENESFRDDSKGMYLGLGINLLNPEDNEIIPTYLDWDIVTSHVGILGASSVGKTILMLSNIKDVIAHGWNSIIIDPKGGNGQEVVNGVFSFCKEKGILNNTHYLSPAAPEVSFLMNPLFGMGNEEIAASIRDMMMSDSTDQFYGDITYKIVLSIMLGFEFLEKISDFSGITARKEIDEENRKHEEVLKTNTFARNLDEGNNFTEVGSVDGLTNEKLFLDSNKDILSKRTLVTFKDIFNYASHANLDELKKIVEDTDVLDSMEGARELRKIKEEAYLALTDTLQQEKEFFGKVSVSLSTLLTKLSLGSVGKIFCTIRTNPMMSRLAAKGESPFVLVVQPFPTRFKDIANTVVKIIMKQVETMLGYIGSTERKIERVAMFIDESGSVFYTGIQNLFNKARSLGGTLFVYTQSYQDYVDAIGETKAKIVLDNITTTIRFRMNDIGSAEIVVKELSQVREFNSTTVASTGTNDSRVIISKTQEDVLSPTDVTMMPQGRGIVKHDGKISLVDFAHYGKIYSEIKFSTNKYFREIDRQNSKYFGNI